MASRSHNRDQNHTSKEGYVEGSIKRIKLENFLTYDSVEFKAGPFLNVIIGPNGSGKSTIVCAICLGLAGKTSWLGRAHQPSDYIKHGCSQAKIELQLFNPDGDDFIIQREINRSSNKSSWKVNGRPCTSSKAVEEKVAQLNIQVGNLCQFLPQEKVADFAKMSQQELLENTEKAAGPPDMYENHQKLKSLAQGGHKLELKYDNLTTYLEQEKQKNARIEQDVKNFELREKHMEKIKVLQMKKPWVEYEDARKMYLRVKEERDRKQEEVKAARSLVAPLREKQEKAQKKKEEYDGLLKAKADGLKQNAESAKTSTEKIEQLKDRVEELQEELKFKQQQEDDRLRKLQVLKDQLQLFHTELSEVDESYNVQPRLDEVNAELRKSGGEWNRIQQMGDSLRMEIGNLKRTVSGLQKELADIQNVANRKLEILRGKHKHTYDAVMWLQQNQSIFKSKVHLPIMMCINMKDPADAKYLEFHISFNDMKAFVCENTEDWSLFSKIMRDEQKLKVSVVSVPPQPLSSFRPHSPISRYSQFGFRSYLRDMFDCDDAIMRYLCALYRVHMIPVGNDTTKEEWNHVVQDTDIHTFYTTNHQYTCRRSKYGGHISAKNSELKDANLLTASVDVQKEKDTLQRLQFAQSTLKEKEEEYKNLQQRSKELDLQMNKLREEKKDLMKKKDQKKRLQSQIASKEENIRRVENDAINLQREELMAYQRIQSINIQKCQSLEKLKDHTRNCLQLSMDKVRLSLRHSSIIQERNLIEEKLREQSQSLVSIEREFDDSKERTKQIRDKAKSLLDTARKATGTSPNAELSPEIKESFSAHPDSIEEIDAAIHEEQARADCTFQTDKKIVEEFNHRKDMIEKITLDQARVKREIDSHKTDVEKTKRDWIGPLNELLGRINENYAYFFKSLKCAGEVDLNIPENHEDYDKYGIRIKVKFRDNEPLRELTPFHQSGGERSVSTVLYMLAMQELARCPFRCVDEINQGMDPVSERKVFELVVNTVCTRSTSQYFLLTPKLLPDLEYDDNVTMLNVYNGSQMINHTEWKLSKFLRRRRRLEES